MKVTAPNLFSLKPSVYNSIQKTDFYSNSLKFLSSDTVSFKAKESLEDKTKLFDDYNPTVVDFGYYKIPVHNEKIANRLQDKYSAKEFSELFDFVDKNGTFNFNVNEKTGYVQTSLIDPKENPLMSKLVWVTDSCNLMPLLKDKYPNICVPLMENMSKYYAGQQRAFDKIINNPLLYEMNHDWPSTAKNGIGHVFNPQNNVSHKWFARTRLDSMGLYLNSMCDLINDGLNGRDYGYKSAKDVSKNAIESIANSAKYLSKIIYPYAKDCGAWEEKTFNATTSSDVAIINAGFRKLLNLMYLPTDNAEILLIRKRLLNAKHGDVFKDEKALRNLLSLGEYRIKTNSLFEVPTERELDGAMSFIFKTEKLDNDVNKNAKAVLKRLKDLEKGTKTSKEIVRDNGILRYINDKYLYLNSDLSGQKAEYNPQRKFPPKTEAQWFMINDVSVSYGLVAKSLLDKIIKTGKASIDTKKLLAYAMTKETEYINRSYARITGENSYKANGKIAPAFQVPEAYQAVTDSKGNIKFVPGTHTPLAWGQVTLYEASKLFKENLEKYEQIFA